MAGNVQDPMALVGKYRAGFTGKVPKAFTQPGKFEIKSTYQKQGEARSAYGFLPQSGHPTPTAPGDGTK